MKIVFWSNMETKRHCQYVTILKKGLNVKSWWFKAKPTEIMKNMNPKVDLKHLDGWFTGSNHERKSVTDKLRMLL